MNDNYRVKQRGDLQFDISTQYAFCQFMIISIIFML
nr:MAG TPA: hypothetical protein [Caudoviricetes sp.]